MIERKPWVGILERLCIHTLLHPYLLSSSVFFCVCRSCGEEEWYEVGCWQVLVGRRRALVRDGRVRCFGHGYMTYIRHTHTHTHIKYGTNAMMRPQFIRSQRYVVGGWKRSVCFAVETSDLSVCLLARLPASCHVMSPMIMSV